MKAIITVGLPACGKSTYARQLAKDGWRIIERDEIRAELMGGNFDWERWDHAREPEVTAIWWERVAKAIEDEADTVFSDTNLTPVYRRKLLQYLTHRGVEVRLVLFDIPMRVCKQRNRARSNPVQKAAYNRMAPLWQQRNRHLRADCERFGVSLERITH